MLFDQPRHRLDGKSELADRKQQLRRDRIALDAAMGGAGQQVRPPLHPDLAGQRLGDLVANAGNLGIEGIEREQRAPFLRRHEQG